MHEPSPTIRRTSLAVLIWAATATVTAFVLGITALLLMVQLREANARLAETEARLAQVTASAPNPVASNRRKARTASPFATLLDTEVAGRYHLFQEGTDVGIITLLTNHSMINKDGTTFAQYHWEIQPDGLMTRWQAGRIFFDVMVKPGVFVMYSKDGSEYRRLEKIEE